MHSLEPDLYVDTLVGWVASLEALASLES
jgi:hypothetical protein